jgi:hypothetical protein
METLGRLREFKEKIEAWYRMPFILFPKEDIDDIVEKLGQIIAITAEKENVLLDEVKKLPSHTILPAEASAIQSAMIDKYKDWCGILQYKPDHQPGTASVQVKEGENREVDEKVCLNILKRTLRYQHSTKGMEETKGEFAERAELIVVMLDRISPIPQNVPQYVQDAIDSERQMLVMRAGWNNMPIDELRKLVNGK